MIRIVLAAALAAGYATSAAAVDAITNLKIVELRSATPACETHPGPFVGRVSGEIGFGKAGGGGSRLAGFVGCFTNYTACTAWRLRTLGAIDGRIVQNSCTQE